MVYTIVQLLQAAISDRVYAIGKGKANPVKAWTGSLGSRNLRLPEFLDNRYMNVVIVSSMLQLLYIQKQPLIVIE